MLAAGCSSTPDEAQRRGNSLAQAGSHGLCIWQRGNGRHHYGELVPAQACCQVPRTQLRLHPPRHLGQQDITGGMTVGVVDLLETIVVKKQQRPRLRAGIRARQRFL